MVSKNPDAFRTISEVADDLDLPQHVLRFWETRFLQIKPMKRGGGRRYYRPDDVDLLRGIRMLLYGEGYTIRGVQRILKEQGARFVIAAGRGEYPGGAEGMEADGVDDPAEAPIPRPRGEPRIEPSLSSTGAEHKRAHKPEARRRPEQVAPPGDGSEAMLSAEDVERLKGTLAQLLECKRLLDQAK